MTFKKNDKEKEETSLLEELIKESSQDEGLDLDFYEENLSESEKEDLPPLNLSGLKKAEATLDLTSEDFSLLKEEESKYIENIKPEAETIENNFYLEPLLEPLAGENMENRQTDSGVFNFSDESLSFLFKIENKIDFSEFQKQEIDNGVWKIESGDAWPVYMLKAILPEPCEAKILKIISTALLRFNGALLRLNYNGEINMFFNNLTELRKAKSFFVEKKLNLFQNNTNLKVYNCRGFLTCALAKADTILLSEKIKVFFAGKLKLKKEISVSVFGCLAGRGMVCSPPYYSDIRVVGAYKSPPTVDYKLLGLSPYGEKLSKGCLGQAIYLKKNKIEIEFSKCVFCGFCQAVDPSFSFKKENDNCYNIYVSGQLKKQSDLSPYLKPKLIKSGLSAQRENLDETAKWLINAILDWHNSPSESLYEYLSENNNNI